MLSAVPDLTARVTSYVHVIPVRTVIDTAIDPPIFSNLYKCSQLREELQPKVSLEDHGR